MEQSTTSQTGRDTGGGSRENDADLRAEMTDLGCRKPARPLPPHLFYPVQEHHRALDPDVVLTVGPAGAGKTTLFETLFGSSKDPGVSDAAPAPSKRTAWRAAFPDHDFPAAAALGYCAGREKTAKRFWQIMLVRRLADLLDEQHRNVLAPMLRRPAPSIDKLLEACEEAGSSPTGALDALEKRLEREDAYVRVGYDQLHATGAGDDAITIRMVNGLLAFWSDYSRRWRRIRPKLFLRTDLMSRAETRTADFAKLAATRAELVWSDAALFTMLVKRIANTSDRLASYCRRAGMHFKSHPALGLMPRLGDPQDAGRFLEQMCGEFIETAHGICNVPIWILARLRDGNDRISPGSVVRLIEQAAGNAAANCAACPPQIIHPAALDEALQEVSRMQIAEAIAKGWPWLAGVKERLAPNPPAPARRERAITLLEADWAKSWGPPDGSMVRPPVDDAGALVDHLIGLGVFRRRSGKRIEVTDLYWSGLGLRRREVKGS